MKRAILVILALVCACLISCQPSNNAATGEPCTIYVNNVRLAAPCVYNKGYEVPVLSVLKALGATVTWTTPHEASILYEGVTYTLNTADKAIYRDGVNVLFIAPGATHMLFEVRGEEVVIDDITLISFLELELGLSMTRNHDARELHIQKDQDESGLENKVSPDDKSLIDLASKVYSESQLRQIVDFSGSIHALNAQYPIECLREEQGFYRVSYLGSEQVAVLFFDGSGNKLIGNIHSIVRSKTDFDSLAEGELLEKVCEIDPNGDYLFLYTGRNDVPRVSYHYTTDGHLISITYNNLNAIIGISEGLI